MLDFKLDDEGGCKEELLMKFTGMSKFPRRAVPSFDPTIRLLMATTNAFMALESSLRMCVPSVPPCCGKVPFATTTPTVNNTLLLIEKDVSEQLPVKNLQEVVPLSSRERASNPDCTAGANTHAHFVIEASIVMFVAAPAFPKRARFLDWAMDAIE
jgi:hypothetical protein